MGLVASLRQGNEVGAAERIRCRREAAAAEERARGQRDRQGGEASPARVDAAAAEQDTTVPDFTLCPITMEVMTNPVIASDGVTYGGWSRALPPPPPPPISEPHTHRQRSRRSGRGWTAGRPPRR